MHKQKLLARQHGPQQVADHVAAGRKFGGCVSVELRRVGQG
jgi:hypothetical protein